jgi:hypothetical protein
MVRARKFRNCSGTEKLVRAVGIENYPTPIKPCKQWCCSHPYRDNHYNHYKMGARQDTNRLKSEKAGKPLSAPTWKILNAFQEPNRPPNGLNVLLQTGA